MKKTSTLSSLFVFLLVNLTVSAQTLYVNHAASGANSGTTWTDAYQTLNEALNNTPSPDTIKVAMGTYWPDTANGSRSSTFLIDTDMILLGGYNALTGERDPELFETILSGDLNDDDEDGNFDDFREDNVMTVVQISANITNVTQVDGFTISNGQADGVQNNQQKRGGGIYCQGSPVLSNLVITQNYAQLNGGGLNVNSTSIQAVEVTACEFQNNKANYGGGVYNSLKSFSYKNCTFDNNVTFDGMYQANGAGLWIVNASGLVQDCQFLDNHAFEFGGGFAIWNPTNSNNSIVDVLDCTFDGNSAGIANGGLSFLSFGNNTSYTAKRCTFINNTSPNSGAGMSINCSKDANNPYFLVDSCYFSQNTAMYNGSAISTILRGNNLELEIRNCQFLNNTASMASAALDLWGTDGGSGTVSVDNCHFEGNIATYSSGMEVGNGWNGGASINYHISNSDFINNEAMQGGAMSFWCSENSSTNITLENCLVQENTATVRGGGIALWPLSNNLNINASKSQIINNESPLGGAIDGFIFDSEVGLLDDISIQFDNCLIANNLSSNAAISLDSITNLSLINCTVADNSGGAIKLNDQSSISLTNTILYNNGTTEIEDVTADGTILSNGGNLIGDNSLGASVHNTDFENADPMFDGTGDNCLKYQISSADSPAVGHGMPGVSQSESDLCGNTRDQGGQIDIGAFESEFLGVDVNEILVSELSVFPNPASEYITIQFPENVTTTFQVLIIDSQGRHIKTESIANHQNIHVKDLVAGLFTIKIKDNNQVYIGKFIKH